jgi:membrane glycosyltransferase
MSGQRANDRLISQSGPKTSAIWTKSAKKGYNLSSKAPYKHPWELSGYIRRGALLILIALPSCFAAAQMLPLLPFQERPALSYIMTGLFAVLFAWISVGFWSSLAGFLLLLLRRDKFKITKGLPPAGERLSLPDDFRTAILFPVYNEDPHKVGEGIRAVRRALKDAGAQRHFDVFILSDTTSPDVFAAEEEAYFDALRAERLGGGLSGDGAREENAAPQRALPPQKNGSAEPGAGGGPSAPPPPDGPGAGPPPQPLPEGPGGGLFYRRRQFNLKRKSGNIGDFCRRWGKLYRYMIVFDADSLMSADCLQRLVLAMEGRPDVGIIQTHPRAIFSATPLSMAQQFAGHLFGTIFAAGLHFWQLGDAQFWGHNAILRTEPFMEHCQLARLTGRSALGGDILSHDFVESALMRRGGYGVWLAYDLEGSWEMTPPSLTDELARDRRWCQGNLQHLRLVFTRGFFPTHRALFINGVMSYGSALLWLAFLLASTAEAVMAIIAGPVYFPEGPSLFTDWPRYFPAWALALLSSTAMLLFFPKLLGVIYVCLRLRCALFGGFVLLCLSVIAEVTISTLLAPARMLFHSWFVLTTVAGFKTGWNPQNRGAGPGLSWGKALRVYWLPTILGVVWGLAMFVLSPGFFYWMSPVAVGLAISIPLAVLTSREGLGRALSWLGIFETPASAKPAREIRLLEEGLKAEPAPGLLNIPRGRGFARAVVLPRALLAHLLTSGRSRGVFPAKAERLGAATAKALAEGPEALTIHENRLILSDAPSLISLHKSVWRLEGAGARRWGIG